MRQSTVKRESPGRYARFPSETLAISSLPLTTFFVLMLSIPSHNSDKLTTMLSSILKCKMLTQMLKLTHGRSSLITLITTRVKD